MSQLRANFKQIHDHLYGDRPSIYSMLLDYGTDYVSATLPLAYAHTRGVRGHCYMNAFKAMMQHDELIYVEGYVTCHGIPLLHGWCEGPGGVLVDPTLDGSEDEYLGIRFQRDFVVHMALDTGYYCILDNMVSRRIYELTPEHWLLPREPIDSSKEISS